MRAAVYADPQYRAVDNDSHPVHMALAYYCAIPSTLTDDLPYCTCNRIRPGFVVPSCFLSCFTFPYLSLLSFMETCVARMVKASPDKRPSMDGVAYVRVRRAHLDIVVLQSARTLPQADAELPPIKVHTYVHHQCIFFVVALDVTSPQLLATRIEFCSGLRYAS